MKRGEPAFTDSPLEGVEQCVWKSYYSDSMPYPNPLVKRVENMPDLR